MKELGNDYRNQILLSFVYKETFCNTYHQEWLTLLLYEHRLSLILYPQYHTNIEIHQLKISPPVWYKIKRNSAIKKTVEENIFPLFLLLFGRVFRRNHLIRLAKSIKTKRSIVTFLKNDRCLVLCLSKEFYCSKNILLTASFGLFQKKNCNSPVEDICRSLEN